jgi:hypothetical protein
MPLDRKAAARLDAWITREPPEAGEADHFIFPWGQEDCDICGEQLPDITGEVGEFVGASFDEDGSLIAHAQCGLDAGYELA